MSAKRTIVISIPVEVEIPDNVDDIVFLKKVRDTLDNSWAAGQLTGGASWLCFTAMRILLHPTLSVNKSLEFLSRPACNESNITVNFDRHESNHHGEF